MQGDGPFDAHSLRSPRTAAIPSAAPVPSNIIAAVVLRHGGFPLCIEDGVASIATCRYFEGYLQQVSIVGAFHAGVQVFDQEYHYGSDSGVVTQAPRTADAEDFLYRCSLLAVKGSSLFSKRNYDGWERSWANFNFMATRGIKPLISGLYTPENPGRF